MPVPYRGRVSGSASPGFGAIFKLFSDQVSGAQLTTTQTFADLLEKLIVAGCEHDVALGNSACTKIGLTHFAAGLAAGLWGSVEPVLSNSSQVTSSSRPALIQNAKTGSDNYLALIYRNPSNDQLYHTYGLNPLAQPTFTPDSTLGAPIEISSIPAKCYSGVSVVRNPSLSGSPDVAAICRNSAGEAAVYQGDVTSNGIDWNARSSKSFVDTDKTPGAAQFASNLVYVWKDSGSSDLYWATESGGTATQIPNVSSEQAPSVVVAANRLWVFYTDDATSGPDDCQRLRYVSTSQIPDPSWVSGEIEGSCSGDWAPEAVWYAPLGGVLGDGKVWLFYRKKDEPNAAAGFHNDGTRVYALGVNSSGGTTVVDGPSDLWQTHPTSAPSTVFFSAVQWGGALYLMFPRDGQSTLLHWMGKAGEG